MRSGHLVRSALTFVVAVVAAGCSSSSSPLVESTRTEMSQPPATVSVPRTSTSVAPSTAPITVATTVAASGTRTNPVPLGVAASVGDGWSMKVTEYVANANDALAKANSFNDPPKAGMQYAMVRVELTYTSAGSEDKSSAFMVSIKAVGPSNVSYSAYETFVVAPDALDVTRDVFKGGSVAGNVVFTVAPGDATDLVVYANAGFGNDEVYFATK